MTDLPHLGGISPEQALAAAVSLLGAGGLGALAQILAGRRRAAAEGLKIEAEADRIRAETGIIDTGQSKAAAAMLLEVLRGLQDQIEKSDEREGRAQTKIDALAADNAQLRLDLTQTRIQLAEIRAEVAAMKVSVARHEKRIGVDYFGPMKYVWKKP